jgi:copper transport protein
MSRLPELLGLLLALALAGPRGAQAHAVLESTSPEDGAAVAQPPKLITLDFSEAISPIFARVLDRDGKSVTEPSDASSVNNQLRISITRALPEGSYMVTYRVVSADTHPVGGAFPFVVGATAPSTGESAAKAPIIDDAAAANDQAWIRLIVFNRTLHLTALLLAAGAALYLQLIDGRGMPGRRSLSALINPLSIIGATSAIFAVGLQGALMAETPLSSLFGNGAMAIWQMGALTTRGASSLIALAGLLLLVVGFSKLDSAAVRSILALGLLACMASVVVAGHAATVEPRWSALPAWIIHTAVAAFWIGSLSPLLNGVAPFIDVGHGIVLRRNIDAQAALPGALRAFGLFSRIALPAVLALLAAGVVLAVLQCGSGVIETLDLSSRYALVLSIKIALVCVLLGLAALNRFVLVPRLALKVCDIAARRALRASLVIELMVGVAVIAAAAVLSQQPPPAALRHAAGIVAPAMGKADAKAVPEPAVIEQSLTSARGHRGRLRITRQPDGSMQLSVQISNAKGESLSPIAVNVELANAAAGIEAMERKLLPATDGSREFRYSGRDLVVPGRWSVRIDAVITDFEQSAFSTTLDIGAR